MSDESKSESLERMKATMLRVGYIVMVIALALGGLALLDRLQG